MNLEEKYSALESWFTNYSDKFGNEEPNFILKKNHSFSVVKIIENLAMSLGFENNKLIIAKIIGLLHDVGRFKQFAEYKTFNDSASVNHAELGWQIIEDENILNDLSEEEIAIISKAIINHNSKEIPKEENEEVLTYIKLIRDADKLDNFKYATEYYALKPSQRNNPLEATLDNSPEVSKKVSKAIINEKVVDKSDIKTLNDFKVLQMSWIYDLNFKRSFQIINENTYLKKIYDTLPKNDVIFDLYRVLRIFFENKLL